MLVAALIVMPRTLLIAHAHTETVDEDFHLYCGLQALYRDLDVVKLNDPPTGEALIALPFRLLGLKTIYHTIGTAIHDQPVSAETLRLLVAGWKAILFIPFVGVVFSWTRKLFGTAGAWLAAGLVIFEPNFAGHIAPATLDVIGVEGIVIACYAWWRYFERQTILRLIVAALLLALALTLKHTAVILPGVVALMWACFWIGRRSEQRLGRQLRHVGITIVVVAAAITLLSGGIQRPMMLKAWRKNHPELAATLERPLPAGWYIGSLANASNHSDRGHRAFLLGEYSRHGWWSYFPIVATYKVPIAVFVLGGFAIASLWRRRLTFDEIGLLLPMIALGFFVIQSGMNVGFRHMLPAYAFGLMWIGGRSLVWTGRLRWAPIGVAAIGAIEVASWHPNYLSYINYPRERVWTQISDSNLDWGQGLKQVREWIDARPADGRPIYINCFDDVAYDYYLGKRATFLPSEGPLPRSGLLIIAPTQLMHVYDEAKTFVPLQKVDPVAIIGDAMLVFDLDALSKADRKARKARATAQRSS